jgi:hypothetical protein
MDELGRLVSEIQDPEITRYFYLDQKPENLLSKLDSLTLRLADKQDDVPFNAQVKGYLGAVDSDGDPWILKPISSEQEACYHRVCALAFILDHWMGTISAPTTVFTVNGIRYRAAKVVKNAVQISSYSYLEAPFIDWLRMDLVNRWLYFDEDRNPNNYLVIHNKRNTPFLVAIDFDKADLEAENMKITGTPDKFGWVRGEKTRFLTLLRPDNFVGVPLETFEPRLAALEAVDASAFEQIARELMREFCADPAKSAKRLADNFVSRRAYIVDYFRKMFKPASETESVSHADDYSMFGESFLAMYNRKK